MNKIRMNILTAAAALTICMMTGCAGTSGTDSGSAENKNVSVSASGDTAEASAQSGDLSKGQSAGAKAAEDLFSDRDLEQTADTSDASALTVKDGETLQITKAGVYVINGSASNCTIVVDAGKDDKVQLVLDGVEITNSDYPAIYVKQADKVFVTLTDADSRLSVTGAFRADGETNTDAVIFSKDDIVFNGTGSLTVESAEGNGISGKEDVKFTGGTYTVTSALDAVEASDTLAVCGGTFTIDSQKDGFHCEESDDNTKGGVNITGGIFNIKAKGDGIQGTTYVQIDGGEITIDSSEGIEATRIMINGGTINITASDDGLNAAAKSTGDSYVEMTGGYTTINMGAGDTDGVDSNGAIYIRGGTIEVNTSFNAFDYDGERVFTGGTIIVNGEEQSSIPDDMMQGGGFGGRGGFGGQRPDGMEPPEGFDGEMPDFKDFEGKEPPEGFDGQMPDFKDFEGKEPPEGFDGKFPGMKGGKPGEKTDSGETQSETSDT